jgi:predicted regulator of Ras-like GTPase activity (Roadblock/LC7/MglB family)
MFKSVLQDVVEKTEGGISSILMGFDGITVESYSKQDGEFNAEDIGMEYSVILGHVKQAAESLNIGTAREVAIQAERMTALIRILNDEYFIALLVNPGGNYGKGRFMLRVNEEKLIESLS